MESEGRESAESLKNDFLAIVDEHWIPDAASLEIELRAPPNRQQETHTLQRLDDDGDKDVIGKIEVHSMDDGYEIVYVPETSGQPGWSLKAGKLYAVTEKIFSFISLGKAFDVSLSNFDALRISTSTGSRLLS